jgi:hypothetical protein
VLGTAGVGYEAGVLVKPIRQGYRIAAAVKSPIDAQLAAQPGVAASTVHVPWEVAFGLAYQFGPRTLNPPLVTAREVARRGTGHWQPTDAELDQAAQELFRRYQESQRWYLLLSTELSVIQGGGPVGLSGQTAMDRPAISPRLGLESEVVPHYLRLRTGSYYEPALIAGTQSRVHGTGGLDVKLFKWSLFGLLAPFNYWQLLLEIPWVEARTDAIRRETHETMLLRNQRQRRVRGRELEILTCEVEIHRQLVARLKLDHERHAQIERG